jgi:hypothetical protein
VKPLDDGPIFALKLSFVLGKLEDDAECFFKPFKYPINLSAVAALANATDYTLVQVQVTKSFEVTCEMLTCRISCHDRARVRFLRQILGRQFFIASDSAAFAVGQQTINHDTRLWDCPKAIITFATHNYIPLVLVMPTAKRAAISPKSGTVRNLVSMLQYRHFFAKSDTEPIPAIRVSVDRVQL